jgi:hypothetical protein
MRTHEVTVRGFLRSETLGLSFPVTYRFEVEILDHARPTGNDIWQILRIHRVTRIAGDDKDIPIRWAALSDEGGLQMMLLEVWDKLQDRGIRGLPPENEALSTDRRERNRDVRRALA